MTSASIGLPEARCLPGQLGRKSSGYFPIAEWRALRQLHKVGYIVTVTENTLRRKLICDCGRQAVCQIRRQRSSMRMEMAD